MSRVIVPSNMALQQNKQKHKSASKGRELLKRKADALKVQFRAITKALIDQKKDLGNKYNQSLIFLAKANWATGEVSRMVDENVKTKSDVKLTLKTKPVAGVTLPIFGLRDINEEKYGDNTQILGITGGGQTLNVTKKHFYEFLKKIVEIATLQTSYLTIDECLKITSRRVNALEYIVLPRIDYVIKYIITELDERSKEEKFKIKKILANKKKHREGEEAVREAEKLAKLTDNNILEEYHEDEEEEEVLFK